MDAEQTKASSAEDDRQNEELKEEEICTSTPMKNVLTSDSSLSDAFKYSETSENQGPRTFQDISMQPGDVNALTCGNSQFYELMGQKLEEIKCEGQHESGGKETTTKVGKESKSKRGTDSESESKKVPEREIPESEFGNQALETGSESVKGDIAESHASNGTKKCELPDANSILAEESHEIKIAVEHFVTPELTKSAKIKIADDKTTKQVHTKDCKPSNQESCKLEERKELDLSENIQQMKVESISIKEIADETLHEGSLDPNPMFEDRTSTEDSTMEHTLLGHGSIELEHNLAKDEYVDKPLKIVGTETQSCHQSYAFEGKSSQKVENLTDEPDIKMTEIGSLFDQNLPPIGDVVRPLCESKEPPKLRNVGNSCYINAVMQCLAVCFRGSFIFEEIEGKKDEMGGLAYCFFKAIHEMNSSGGSEVSLDGFRHEMAQKSGKYATFGQQDAFEFLMFIFKNVGEQLKKIDWNVFAEKFAFETKTVLTPTCSHEWTKTQKEFAVILSPSIENFQVSDNKQSPSGWFQWQVGKWIKNKYKAFISLFNLTYRTWFKGEIGAGNEKGNYELKLEDLLGGFFKKEDHYKILCPTCLDKEKLFEGTMELQLESVPEILVVYINRCDASRNGSKLDESVEVKLDDFKVEYSQGSSTYSAIAYCEHRGSLCCGHYKAHVRVNIPGPWYECNDSHVTPCKKQYDSIKSRDVYMVFYKKQGRISQKFQSELDIAVVLPINYPSKSIDNVGSSIG